MRELLHAGQGFCTTGTPARRRRSSAAAADTTGVPTTPPEMAGRSRDEMRAAQSGACVDPKTSGASGSHLGRHRRGASPSDRLLCCWRKGCGRRRGPDGGGRPKAQCAELLRKHGGSSAATLPLSAACPPESRLQHPALPEPLSPVVRQWLTRQGQNDGSEEQKKRSARQPRAFILCAFVFLCVQFACRNYKNTRRFYIVRRLYILFSPCSARTACGSSSPCSPGCTLVLLVAPPCAWPCSWCLY